jgi:hypothetical protein
MTFFEAAIPVIFFATIGLVTGAWIFARHKERITMIERGMGADDIKALYTRGYRLNPLSSLKWGMVLSGIGVAVLLGLWMRSLYGVEEGIFPALITLCGGLALIIFYMIAKKKIEN